MHEYCNVVGQRDIARIWQQRDFQIGGITANGGGSVSLVKAAPVFHIPWEKISYILMPGEGRLPGLSCVDEASPQCLPRAAPHVWGSSGLHSPWFSRCSTASMPVQPRTRPARTDTAVAACQVPSASFELQPAPRPSDSSGQLWPGQGALGIGTTVVEASRTLEPVLSGEIRQKSHPHWTC